MHSCCSCPPPSILHLANLIFCGSNLFKVKFLLIGHLNKQFQVLFAKKTICFQASDEVGSVRLRKQPQKFTERWNNCTKLGAWRSVFTLGSGREKNNRFLLKPGEMKCAILAKIKKMPKIIYSKKW